MDTSVYIIIGSSVVIAVLLLLFKMESKHNFRLFSLLRHKLDNLVLLGSRLLKKLASGFTDGKLRVVSHFLIHKILSFVIAIIKKIEGYFIYLQMRNKKVVKETQRDKNNNHLSAVKDHKDSVALSDIEKKELREKSLEG